MYIEAYGVCKLTPLFTPIRPLQARNRKKQNENILTAKLKLPTYLSQEACSLLKGLLQKDREQRLGSLAAEDIKRHPFFKGVNWRKLEALQVRYNK